MATTVGVEALPRPMESYIKIPIVIPELEQIMADTQETQQKVDNLSGKIDLMQTRVTEDVQALRDQLAQANIDQATLDTINSGLDRIIERVDAIDPTPDSPPPTP